MRCKGPGGVIAVWQDYDDATGAWIQTRIISDVGARSKVIACEAGIWREVAQPNHPGLRAIPAPPGKFYMPRVGDIPAVEPWSPMEISS